MNGRDRIVTATRSITSAHSLKTPLAAMRALIGDVASQRELHGRFNEQIDRMDEIVRYQLRKPAASVADNLVLASVPVAREVDRLVGGLRKVYHDKQPDIASDIAAGMQFRGDTGDFLEVAGNLLDNACKWCEGRVRISVHPSGDATAIASGMVLSVDDDGPGIPEEAAEALLERGTRLDEASAPGHGIGLAIVKDIARSLRRNVEDLEIGTRRGPDYRRYPARGGVARELDSGRSASPRLPWRLSSRHRSKIFPGTDVTLDKRKPVRKERMFYVYIPAAYRDGDKAPILVMHDGPSRFEFGP